MLVKVERLPPLTIAQVKASFHVDLVSGRCEWKKPSKFHNELTGKEAGFLSGPKQGGVRRWIIKFKGYPYKRAYLTFLMANGYWPDLVDHIDGNPLNDRPENLREATILQNNWNQRTHKKKSPLPRGVRKLSRGGFQARIRCMGVTTYRTFQTSEQAEKFYIETRRRYFGAYCGL